MVSSQSLRYSLRQMKQRSGRRRVAPKVYDTIIKHKQQLFDVFSIRMHQYPNLTLSPSICYFPSSYIFLMLFLDQDESQLQTIIICMPLKYIHIKQLYARSPFSQAQVHFMVRVKQKQAMPLEMGMQNKMLSVTLNEYMQFQYHLEQRDELALYVIVIGGSERVVNIGYLGLDLKERINEKKQYLKGVTKQNGYLIYSIRDQPFPQQSILLSVSQNRQKNKAKSQVFTKHADLASQTKSNFYKGNQTEPNMYATQQQYLDHNQQLCRSISSPRNGQNKGYDSLIDVFNAGSNELALQNNKSEGHFQSSHKNKHSPYSGLDSSVSKYKKARQKLAVHKQKNNNYSSELAELQRELARQQQKIKQLGISQKQ